MRVLTASVVALASLQCADSFNINRIQSHKRSIVTNRQVPLHRSSSSLQASTETTEVKKDTSQKLARLNAMAASLRAEASALEAEQQVEVNVKLSQAFQALDTNNDGSISLQELKDALFTQLESVVNEEQAVKIMKRFDTSGDGAIQLDEFKGIEAFRMTFEKVLLEEKAAGVDALNQLRLAKDASELAAKKVAAVTYLVAAVTDQVNSLPATNNDKIVSLIPYLLPLCDALPYARGFIENNGLQENNLIFAFAAVIFNIYQAVPFSGLIAFFLFSSIANNLKLNRLVRFNIQQAIFLDIALIVPGIIGGIAGVVATQAGGQIDPSLVDAGSTATFLAVSAAIIYSMGSTLTGTLPDKIPFVSERVKVRVPTAEDILRMLNEQENMLMLMEKTAEEKKIEDRRKEREERNKEKEENNEE